MDWINKINMITEKMKNQMHAKGIDSIDKVFIQIAQFDQPGKGYVEKINFEIFLSKLGIFLKTQELTEIHKYLQTDENAGQVLFENFIALLKCEVPDSLTNEVVEVFNLIQDGSGFISLESIKDRVRIDHHPRVKLMLKKQDIAMNEFELSLRFILGDKTSMNIDEFLEFHRNMYWVTPRENLTYFYNMIPDLWGCK